MYVYHHLPIPSISLRPSVLGGGHTPQTPLGTKIAHFRLFVEISLPPWEK